VVEETGSRAMAQQRSRFSKNKDNRDLQDSMWDPNISGKENSSILDVHYTNQCFLAHLSVQLRVGTSGEGMFADWHLKAVDGG
jgi:hypothetical protein